MLLPSPLPALILACAPAQFDLDEQADLTPFARRWLHYQELRQGPLPAVPAAYEFPETIRVWRRDDGASASCSGTVETLDFDDYVKGVLPGEWYASWDEESLKAGVVSIRSYATWWVNAGGKYDCADVCDTTSTQHYDDDRDSRTNAAVDAMPGVYAVDTDGVIFAEYSAENGDPTDYGVSDSVCSGESRNGHGRGLCQWGSQRWAQAGQTYDWIIEHYYPDAWILAGLDAEVVDPPDPIVLSAGASTTVAVRYENLGSATWGSSRVFLQPTSTSSFQHSDWASASRAAAVSGSVAYGDTGSFSLSLTAPDISEDTDYTETFRLFDADWGEWFGDTLTLSLSVTAGEQVDSADPDSGGQGGGSGGAEGGGSGGGGANFPRQAGGKPGDAVGLDETAGGCGTVLGGYWGLGALLVARRRRRGPGGPS